MQSDTGTQGNLPDDRKDALQHVKKMGLCLSNLWELLEIQVLREIPEPSDTEDHTLELETIVHMLESVRIYLESLEFEIICRDFLLGLDLDEIYGFTTPIEHWMPDIYLDILGKLPGSPTNVYEFLKNLPYITKRIVVLLRRFRQIAPKLDEIQVSRELRDLDEAYSKLQACVPLEKHRDPRSP